MSLSRKRQRKPSLLSVMTITAALGSIAFMLILLTGTVKLYNIPTGGMEPTFQPGDRIVTTRAFSTNGGVERGSPVVFIPPTNPNTRFIQRVVAVPGDTVELIDGHLAVNGILLTSPTGLNSSPAPSGTTYPGMKPPIYPLTLPEDKIFLLGDNYENSLDSRCFGPVSSEDITHIPQAIVFPAGRMARIK